MSNILTQRTITGITTFVLTRQCLFYKIFTLIYDFINPFSFSCQFVIITHYYINDASTEALQTSVLWQLYQFWKTTMDEYFIQIKQITTIEINLM